VYTEISDRLVPSQEQMQYVSSNGVTECNVLDTVQQNVCAIVLRISIENSIP